VTYTYAYTDRQGGTVEIAHSMSEPARTEHYGRPVKRIISDNSHPPVFKYDASATSGWSSHGYAKPENHRQAEHALGRKLFKPKDT
jgi:hypothetical protein